MHTHEFRWEIKINSFSRSKWENVRFSQFYFCYDFRALELAGLGFTEIHTHAVIWTRLFGDVPTQNRRASVLLRLF